MLWDQANQAPLISGSVLGCGFVLETREMHTDGMSKYAYKVEIRINQKPTLSDCLLTNALS